VGSYAAYAAIPFSAAYVGSEINIGLFYVISVSSLVVVGLLQLAGLGYGLWTVHEARPVHLVFEIDRFRAVHAVEVPEELLASTPSGIVALPVTGPSLLAVRPFTGEHERVDATVAALQGLHLGARPDFWQAYEQAVPRVLAAAKPVSQLKSRFPAQTGAIDAVMAATGRSVDGLVYLPLVSRKSFWTVLLDARTAQILGFVPLDSF